MKQTINLTKGRCIFVMQCGLHAYMESWGMAVENFHYAISHNNGSLALSDVAPGESTLVAWHPQAGPMLEQKVTVGPRRTFTVSFQFKVPTGRRSAYEIVENPYFGLEGPGKSWEIRPTLLLQKL